MNATTYSNLYAMRQALEMKQKNECLGCLEFIAC